MGIEIPPFLKIYVEKEPMDFKLVVGKKVIATTPLTTDLTIAQSAVPRLSEQ